jgi:hypothetical protein
MTKTERYTDHVIGIVKPQGNSGHITLPKEWIGQEVCVMFLDKAKALLLDKELKRHRIRGIK